MYEFKYFDTIVNDTTDKYGEELLDASWENIQAKKEACKTVFAIAEQKGCVCIRPTDDYGIEHWSFLHPSLRIDGYQLSNFDKVGPTSHDNIGYDVDELAYNIPDRFEVIYREEL